MDKKEIPIPQEILEMIGDPKILFSRLERFRRDAIYFEQNYDQLRRDFPDEWVAIQDERVISHSRNHRGLVNFLRETNIGTKDVYFGRTYFREKRPTFILQAV